jgi:hypothetical protein
VDALACENILTRRANHLHNPTVEDLHQMELAQYALIATLMVTVLVFVPSTAATVSELSDTNAS